MSSISPTTRWLALGLAFALGWAFFLATMGRVRRVGELEPPALEMQVATTVVDFGWTLEDIQGKPVKLEDYKGRVIVLNIWATWCVPCVTEMPSLARLAENPRIKSKNVAILCISNDEDSRALREFLKEKPWPMTMLRSSTFPPGFLTDSIPTTFVIDPAGQIVSVQVGAALWDDPSVIEFLEKLK
jgi:thiol-disulfide isomerase/thioredoxin